MTGQGAGAAPAYTSTRRDRTVITAEADYLGPGPDDVELLRQVAEAGLSLGQPG